MSDYEVVGTVRLEYDDEEINPESAKENLRQMVRDGTLSLNIDVEYPEE